MLTNRDYFRLKTLKMPDSKEFTSYLLKRAQLDLFYVGRHSVVAALTKLCFTCSAKHAYNLYTPLPHLLFVQLDDHFLIATRRE